MNNWWCEGCARKDKCYTSGIKPKCFVPITNTAHGTPQNYLVKAMQESRDSHEIADTPQTEKADRIPYDPLVEMDIKRVVEERLRQTETSTNSEKLQSGVELKQMDCPWK